MGTTDKNLTAQESLEIIAAMIRQAKGNVQKNSFYFLLWGWVVVAANLGVYGLTQAGYSRPYLVWLITIPAWFASMVYAYRNGKRRDHSTILGQLMLWTWVSFGVTIFILIFFGYKINYQLNPLILLVSGIPTMVSGIAMRFTPLVVGGILFWISGIACFMVSIEYQNLIAAAAVAIGYLIPGYQLKNKRDT